MPHRETEQNQKRKRQAFSRTPRHKRSSESKQELFYRICWNLRYWLAVLYCANREQHEPKCATWAVVTFLMQAEEDRLRQMCSVFHFLSFFFYTISTQNKSRRCSTLLSLSLFLKWTLCSSAHIFVWKNYIPLNKQRLETYPTTKTAGASAEKENHCCRYSVKTTICFDCLSATCLWCSQCLLFVFACVFGTSAFLFQRNKFWQRLQTI